MSKIKINQSAFFNNVANIGAKFGGTDKIIAVLKDNAYGHGARIMSALARESGIKFACVRNEIEAQEIEEFFEQVLILSHIPNGNESEKFIYAINSIQMLNSVAPKTRIHLAFDTLMHRNGLTVGDIDEALKICKKRGLKLLGAYTHFRSADELNGEFFVQKTRFGEIKKLLRQLAPNFGFNELVFHSCASSAAARIKNFDDDFVRVGLSLYGYNDFDDSLKLRPVMSLYADKISSRILKKAEKIGYGGKFCASKDLSVATYDLGYGDGLFRFGGSGVLCLKNGSQILGRMSMDSFSSIDCGDEVCVFDNAREMADFFGTIVYEILVKLSPKIPRVLV